jgi:hypothetical protein
VLLQDLTYGLGLLNTLGSVRTRSDGFLEEQMGIREEFVNLDINVVRWLQTTSELRRSSHEDRSDEYISRVALSADMEVQIDYV